MKKKVIVCVDDEAIILMALRQELKNNLGDKYLYDSAMNAREALQVIEDHLLEGDTEILVITDWLMPGMKGDDFLIFLREKHPEIRSIMITGQADNEAIERVLNEVGTCTVLGKPWTTAELIQAVEFCSDEGAG